MSTARSSKRSPRDYIQSIEEWRDQSDERYLHTLIHPIVVCDMTRHFRLKKRVHLHTDRSKEMIDELIEKYPCHAFADMDNEIEFGQMGAVGITLEKD